MNLRLLLQLRELLVEERVHAIQLLVREFLVDQDAVLCSSTMMRLRWAMSI